MDSGGGTNGVTFDDAYTDEIDMIGICHILDATPHKPHSAFDVFGFSMLELDGDDSIINAATPGFTYVEGMSDPVDPSFSFDSMFRFVTRYDSDCDSDSEERKVTLVSGSTESVDFGTSNQPKELKIGSSLSLDERSRLINLLKSYLDLFSWSYEDMLGRDPSINQHHLPILRLHPRWSLQVKEEIKKQLNVGFLSMVEYLEWLANVVPIPKKDDKVRVCVDFKDLNKASPKDDFPLPCIDMLVDSTTGHSMLTFDMEKTSFITKWGTYCYKVMSFRLKNVGATYQRAGTTLFHDMMHKDVEVYMDDMRVKSRDKADHLTTL
ncbi:hypothetical protein AAG906_001724 [Vitis piasezkii]